MLSSTREETPSASTSRQSRKRPIEKPATAPVRLPPSRARQTTRAGRMSGLTWKSSTWEKKESCSSTPIRPIAAMRATIFGVRIMTMPRASLPARGTRDARLVAPRSFARAPGQHLDEVEVADVGEGAHVGLFLGLLVDDRGLGHFAQRQARWEERAETLGAPTRGDHGLAAVDQLGRVDEVEDQVFWIADFGLDDTLHAGGQHLGRDRAGVVGQQHHL